MTTIREGAKLAARKSLAMASEELRRARDQLSAVQDMAAERHKQHALALAHLADLEEQFEAWIGPEWREVLGVKDEDFAKGE